MALPCMVPREWIQVPDGGSLDEEEEEESNVNNNNAAAAAVDERASMLESERHTRLRDEQKRCREEDLRVRKEKRKSLVEEE